MLEARTSLLSPAVSYQSDTMARNCEPHSFSGQTCISISFENGHFSCDMLSHNNIMIISLKPVWCSYSLRVTLSTCTRVTIHYSLCMPEPLGSYMHMYHTSGNFSEVAYPLKFTKFKIANFNSTHAHLYGTNLNFHKYQTRAKLPAIILWYIACIDCLIFVAGDESPRSSQNLKAHFRRRKFQSPQLRSRLESILQPPPSSLIQDLL